MMYAKPKTWLVAQAPDGSGLILPRRTAAGWSMASVQQDSEGRWHLTGVWGSSAESVRSRTRTQLGHHDFRVVPVRPLEDAIPDAIATYFGITSWIGLVVRQVFYPGGGWTSPREWKRPSVAYLRLLRAQGAEAIGVGTSGNASQVADFQLDEIIGPGRPLFGGSLIGSKTRSPR